MSTHTSVSLYNQPVTWIFTRSRLSSFEFRDWEWFGLQSNPFIEKYYLIIVVFSCPHFSIYDIFYTLENTRSFNERATHFKVNHATFTLSRKCICETNPWRPHACHHSEFICQSGDFSMLYPINHFIEILRYPFDDNRYSSKVQFTKTLNKEQKCTFLFSNIIIIH